MLLLVALLCLLFIPNLIDCNGENNSTLILENNLNGKVEDNKEEDKLRIAICVMGQIKTFHKKQVHESQNKWLINSLKKQSNGVLDSFIVFETGERTNTETIKILNSIYTPYDIRYLNVDHTLNVANTSTQFWRFPLCYEMIKEKELKYNMKYDWIIRSRPDFFYGDVPKLNGLSTDYIYARYRCGIINGTFTENSISGENQQLLRGVCRRNPLHCNCLQRKCEAIEKNPLRMDDQFAIVPRKQADLYFGSYEEERHNMLKYNTNNGSYCKSRPLGNECLLTKHVTNNGGKFSTMPISHGSFNFGLYRITNNIDGMGSPAQKQVEYRCNGAAY